MWKPPALSHPSQLPEFIPALCQRYVIGRGVATSTGSPRSRHGLNIYPDQSAETAKVDEMLATPPSEAPAMILEQELPRIASRYDRPTAGIVALVMEYPWASDLPREASR